MKTANEIEQAFRQDLEALLAKHKAELEITSIRDSCLFNFQRPVVLVSMMNQWDEDGNQTAEYAVFEL